MVAPNLRILLVEDQGELRHTFVAMLKRMGAAAVHNAPSGEEALETISQTPIDFIISEWSLPEMSGMDLLREVRENPITSGIPFIMLSNQGELSEDEIAKSSDYDVDGHLLKPLNHKRFESQVKESLEKRADFMETSVRLARAAAFVDISAAKEVEITSAQEEKPESSRVWVESGQLFEALGDDTKAKKSYVQAAEVDEDCAKAYEGMSNILTKEGKSDEAFKLLQKAVKICPRNRDRQMKMTKHLLDSGDEEAARVALHKALEYETTPPPGAPRPPNFSWKPGAPTSPRSSTPSPSRPTPKTSTTSTGWASPSAARKNSGKPSKTTGKPTPSPPTTPSSSTTWPSPSPKAGTSTRPSVPSAGRWFSNPSSPRPNTHSKTFR